MANAVKAANGRVPVLSGVAETTTAQAVQYAKDAEAIGIDGLMVLPGMVYRSTERRSHSTTTSRLPAAPTCLS